LSISGDAEVMYAACIGEFPFTKSNEFAKGSEEYDIPGKSPDNAVEERSFEVKSFDDILKSESVKDLKKYDI
jgi:hypothetical protein